MKNITVMSIKINYDMKTFYILNRVVLVLLLAFVFYPNTGYADFTNGGSGSMPNSQTNPHYIFVYQMANGNNDGTSWYNAFTDLQSALDVAHSGDSILIAEGNYTPSKDAYGNSSPANNREKTFVIPQGVKLFGGFDSPNYYGYGNGNGNEDRSFWDSRKPFKNIAYLSGEIGSNVLTDNCYNVVRMSDSTELNGVYVLRG
jgi:hypothetical protein